MVDGYLFPNFISLLQTERVVLSFQEYNRVRRVVIDRIPSCINKLDFYFLKSRFTPQGWNELPDLLNSGRFDDLIRTVMDQATFDMLRNLALQAQQQAIQDKNQKMANLLQGIINGLEQIRGNILQ